MTQQLTVELQCIAAFTRLEELILFSARLPDLQPLVVLRELRALALVLNTHLVDESLRVLAGFTKLQELVLSECSNLTDDALVHVGTSVQLRLLGLMNLPITDAGLMHLAPLLDLRDLALQCHSVTKNGLEHLCARLDCLVLDDKWIARQDIKPPFRTRLRTTLPRQFKRYFEVHQKSLEL